jgi:hypothetical protein
MKGYRINSMLEKIEAVELNPPFEVTNNGTAIANGTEVYMGFKEAKKALVEIYITARNEAAAKAKAVRKKKRAELMA